VSSGSRLQVALAIALTDPTVLADLATQPAQVGERFGLCETEIADLQRLDMTRLQLTARLGRAKRLDFLSRALPHSFAALARSDDRGLLWEFVGRTMPVAKTGPPNRILQEARTFVRFVTSTTAHPMPAFVPDLARYELARLELLASRTAIRSAKRQAATPTPALAYAPDGLVVRLTDAVRVDWFDHDVLALANSAPIHSDNAWRTPTCIVLARKVGAPPLAAYRVGWAAAEILTACRQPRSVADLVAAVPDPDQAKQAILAAVADGVLIYDQAQADMACE
jgi:hypothetical protein